MRATTKSSVRRTAKVAGLFYLLEMLTGGFAMFVAGRLFVQNDNVATANNIVIHSLLLQFGFAANVLQFACYIAVTCMLYALLKPVSSGLSRLAACFSLVGCAVGAISCLFEIAPLAVLRPAPYLGVFSVEQLQALGLVFLKLYVLCFNISFVFFGFYCLLIGYLVIRSSFLPRVLGAGMVLAGAGWLTFLLPFLTQLLSPYIVSVGLGEVALTAWLITVGVNSERWDEQAKKIGDCAI